MKYTSNFEKVTLILFLLFRKIVAQDTPGYEIDYTFSPSPDGENVLRIQTVFGNNTDLGTIELYEKGCDNPIQDSVLTLHSIKNITEESKVKVSDMIIETSKLISSGILAEGGSEVEGTIEFCLKIIAFETSLTDDPIAISKISTNHQIPYSGADVNFGISFGLNPYFCLADSTDEYIPTDGFSEGDVIYLCLVPTGSEGLNIFTLDMNVLFGNQQELPLVVENDPISFINMEHGDIDESANDYVRVRIPVLSDFFVDPSRELVISGNADIGFTRNTPNERNGDIVENSNFEIRARLFSTTDLGCRLMLQRSILSGLDIISTVLL